MSEIVTLEPPQDRAVTLEEARQQLRLDAHDEDLLLGAKLDAAQAELEQQTGLKLCEQTLELQLEGWKDEITVPVRPCTVAEIRYMAASGAMVTLPETVYVTRRRHRFTRIRPAFGKSWPELRADSLIRITLSAGFSENDPDLAIARAAILVKTAAMFENREGGPCLAFDTLVGQLKCRWI
ncbi:phage head-tail connector protein [Sphingobium sp. DEHP117]|uniref:head-tail connector protein n=1 Tax=Sphingobium sp. DEHP117 TaxID=2993436 RepID=UPI0027D57992|nr:phage head-tail connector protein [Sphingobium sp. DEHP117]MDQ4421646.1 phage head-tail connector protein [Sphingobium sp. DEHP117]